MCSKRDVAACALDAFRERRLAIDVTAVTSIEAPLQFHITQEVSVMSVYLVERDLPGVTTEQLGAAQKAAIEKGEEFTANGKDVRYIRSIFVPGESKCMCLFEAANPELVKEVNEAAQIPFTSIKEAFDLTPR